MDTETRETLRQHLYAVSPHDLASLEDDLYRDAIDDVLDDERYKMQTCAQCGADMYGTIRVHHHTEKGVDVTK